MSIRIALLTVIALCASITAQASNDVRFFTLIPDMVVMESLEELEDQSYSYDKPEGRFVETLAFILEGTAQHVSAYYQNVLPQLGWARAGRDAYTRGAERMEIHFEQQEDTHLMRVTISPR